MQAIHFRAFLAWQALNGCPEGVNVGAVRDAVAEAAAVIPVQLNVGLRWKPLKNGCRWQMIDVSMGWLLQCWLLDCWQKHA